MKNKFYQKWWFWVCIVAIICVILVSIILINKGQKKDTRGDSNIQKVNSDIEDEMDDYDNSKQLERQVLQKNENLKKNIIIEAIGITKNGDFAFKLKNNNNEKIYVQTIETIFKDSAGNFVEKVESDASYFIVKENSEIVLYDDGYQKDFSKYPSYEFSVVLDDSRYIAEKTVIDNLELIHNKTQDQLSKEIKNKNSIPLKDITVLVAYYKDNQNVGCKSISEYNVVSPNSSGYLNVDYPKDKEYETVEFDKYEVYLLSAEK